MKLCSKSDYVKSMRSYVGGAGMMTRLEFADWMHYKDAHSVDKYIHDLYKVGKKYLIEDLAEALIARRTV